MSCANTWFNENVANYNLYNDPEEMVLDAFNAGLNKNINGVDMVRTGEYGGTYYILEVGGGVTPINKRAYDLINQQNTIIKKLKTNQSK